MRWVSQPRYNMVKTDFFEAKATYAKNGIGR